MNVSWAGPAVCSAESSWVALAFFRSNGYNHPKVVVGYHNLLSKKRCQNPPRTRSSGLRSNTSMGSLLSATGMFLSSRETMTPGLGGLLPTARSPSMANTARCPSRRRNDRVGKRRTGMPIAARESAWSRNMPDAALISRWHT